MEHGIHCLLCSCTNDVVTSSGCHSVKVLSAKVGYSLVAKITDIVISLMIRGEHGIQCMPCSFRIISEMLPEIHRLDKCHFLKSKIHSQITFFFNLFFFFFNHIFLSFFYYFFIYFFLIPLFFLLF